MNDKKENNEQRIGVFTGKYGHVCANTYTLLNVVFGWSEPLRDFVCRQFASDLGRAKFTADGTSIKLALSTKEGQRKLSQGQKGTVANSRSVEVVAVAQALHKVAQGGTLRPHKDKDGNPIGLFPDVVFGEATQEWIETHTKRLQDLSLGAITEEQSEAIAADFSGAAPGTDGGDDESDESDE